MKILHTADWHLGKRLDAVSRHQEQVVVLEEICAIADAEDVDAVVIAGDLFDTYNPPTESIDLFYKICKRLTNNGLRPVIAIAGNHDSPERIEAPDPLARACGIVFAGFPDSQVPLFSLPTGLSLTKSEQGFIALKLPRFDYPLNILLTPFANEERLKKYFGETDKELILRELLKEKWEKSLENVKIMERSDIPNPFGTEGVNLLVSHLLFVRDNQAKVEEDDGEKPIYIGTASAILPEDVPAGLHYVALGHLHRFHYVGKSRVPIVYSGSPLAYSFNEDNQEKYVVIIEAKPKEKAVIREIALKNVKKLVRITANNVPDAYDKLALVPDALVQLSLRSQTFLDPSLLQTLYDFHSGIVKPIIPILTVDTEGVEDERALDFNNIENMFINYFKSEEKVEPNEALLALFREVIASHD
jgi:DNA repair protein SbcD/Mre11